MNLLQMALVTGLATTIVEDEKKKRERNTIKIPDNATNGDVIKAMFPSAEFKEGIFSVFMYPYNFNMSSIDKEWWNAPYKKESAGDADEVNN